MPQKKNPDSLELLRGKSGRIFGNMAGFMVTLKGLPSTYNKDLQEDKEPLFDTVDNVSASLKIAEGVIATMNVSSLIVAMELPISNHFFSQVHGEKMRQALSADALATDLAEYLVRKGVPFRETHHISGRAVALAESRSCQISELSVDDFKKLDARFGDDVMAVFNFETSVEHRASIGGTSLAMVQRQVDVLRAALRN